MQMIFKVQIIPSADSHIPRAESADGFGGWLSRFPFHLSSCQELPTHI